MDISKEVKEYSNASPSITALLTLHRLAPLSPPLQLYMEINLNTAEVDAYLLCEEAERQIPHRGSRSNLHYIWGIFPQGRMEKCKNHHVSAARYWRLRSKES